MAQEELIRQIHASPLRGVLYLTGGGSRAVSALLTRPGASRTVLEVRIPYSLASLVDLLGERPEHALSATVAAALAERARQRATELTDPEVDPNLCVGLGCTAGLATDRPRHGPHCAYVGLCAATGTQVNVLRLTKGARCRREEEDLVAAFVLNILAAAAGIVERAPLELLSTDEIREVATGG